MHLTDVAAGPSASIVPFPIVSERQVQEAHKAKRAIEHDFVANMLSVWGGEDEGHAELHGLTARDFSTVEFRAIVEVTERLEKRGGSPADLMAGLAVRDDIKLPLARQIISNALEFRTGKPADYARSLREINARLAMQGQAAQLGEMALDLAAPTEQLIAWHNDQIVDLRRLGSSSVSRFSLCEGESVLPPLDLPELVRGLLPGSGKALLYGASNTGKSFAALDLACRIATGMEWHNRRTEAGPVLYLAAENPDSIRRRAAGWAIHHDMTIPSNLIVATRPGSLLDKENVTALAEECRRIQDRKGRPLRLVVIDTLAMMMPGGDENSAEDMGQAIAACDEIAAATGGMVLIIHHAGKDEGRGARGWSGLRAAMDVELEATEGKLFVTKSRDGEKHVEFTYQLDKVEIGENRYGETVTTLVPRHGETIQRKGPRTPAGQSRPVRLSDAAKVVQQALQEAVAREGRGQPDSSIPPAVPQGVQSVRIDLLRDYHARRSPDDAKSDTVRKTLTRGIEKLLAHRIIRVQDGWVWFERDRGNADA